MVTNMEDYQSYLESVFPGTTWEIDPINGGYINTTIRVVKASGIADADTFILKHARPTFGEGNRVRQFSLKRQVSSQLSHYRQVINPIHLC